MTKKRVLFVINTPFVNAGVPHVIMAIVEGLKDKYDFDLVSYSSSVFEGDREKEFLNYGGNIKKYKIIDYSKHKVLFILNKFIIKHNITNIIKNGNYDIIHCNNGLDAGIVMKIAKKHGIRKRIAHSHGQYDRNGKNYLLRFYNNQNKKKIEKYASNKLSCSNKSGNSMYLSKEFKNIYNPVNVSYFSKIKHIKHEEINLLQIGYFCRNKNQIFSVEVLKELVSNGRKANLYFIGFVYEQDYFDLLNKKIKEYELEKNVIFLDKNTDKRKYFGIIDFLLLPSFSEGLSITTLEAQAANIPCIVSSIVSDDCNCGLVEFLDNNNPKKWASLINNYDSSSHCINEEKINLIDIKGYCKEIENIYES